VRSHLFTEVLLNWEHLWDLTFSQWYCWNGGICKTWRSHSAIAEWGASAISEVLTAIQLKTHTFWGVMLCWTVVITAILDATEAWQTTQCQVPQDYNLYEVSLECDDMQAWLQLSKKYGTSLLKNTLSSFHTTTSAIHIISALSIDFTLFWSSYFPS